MKVEYTVYFPVHAAITRVDLNGKTQIVPRNRSAALDDQHDGRRPHRSVCADGLGKFSLLLTMKAGEEMTLDFEYEEILLNR